MSRGSRIVAALIAACAWIGLGIDFAGAYGDGRTVVATLWLLLAYFAIATNLALAVVLTAVALGYIGCRQESMLAGLTVTIALVGIVYAALLHGTMEISGVRRLSNVLLHVVTPVLTVVFWLGFVPKGRLEPGDPLRWTLLPFTYLVYYIVRGGMTWHYPYPFMNPTRVGWPSALVGMAGTALLFLMLGYLMLWLDQRWQRDVRRRAG